MATMRSQMRLRDVWRRIRSIYGLVIAPWPPFALFLVAGAIIGGLTPLLQIWATRSLIDALAASPPAPPGQSPLELLAPYLPQVLVIVGTLAVQGLVYSGTIQQYLGAHLTERVQEKFEHLFYSRVLSLRLEWLERPEYYDTLERARQVMCGRVHVNVFWSLLSLQNLVANLFGCLGVVWFFGSMHWGIAALVLLGSGIVLNWQVQNVRIVMQVVWGQTPLQRRRNYWQDLLLQRQAAPEIRLFALDGHLLHKWRCLTEEMLGEYVAALRRMMRRGMAVIAGEIGISGIVMLSLIFYASQGRISVGTLVALIYAIPRYLQMLLEVSSSAERLQNFVTELGHVQAFLDLDRSEAVEGKKPPPRLVRGIRFDDVAFTYPGGSQPALSDIDLDIRPGERIALVGENGAGKTTLVKLLLGLYRPTAGCIQVDGTDLAAIAPRTWRARTGAVFQDYVRYAFTIRENIGFGQLDKLDDWAAIARAAQLSSAAEMIEALPDGYETRLGREFEDGRDLSGGQWQKLAIARVYMRDAEILVLDEPTSALDALAEREVYRHFLELSWGKTVVLVSHRLGSVRLADRILFLQHGRIVEQGTHGELMAAAGPYAELYTLQAEWYREK